MLVIGWLAILVCVWTAGDRVFDLVFEEPDLVADAAPTAEEPDNAAEHVLMPSPRAGSAASDAVTSAPDLATISVVVTVTDNTALEAAPPHPPPRSTPVSFSVPLRI